MNSRRLDTTTPYLGCLAADAILVDGGAKIDYSFVTGESTLVRVALSDWLFAGGRQVSWPSV